MHSTVYNVLRGGQKGEDAMEALNVLEQKVNMLVEKYKQSEATIHELRHELDQVKEEKHKLENKLEQAENQLLSQYQNSEQLDEERQQAKQMVDELIYNIDNVMHEDSQNG